MTGGFIAPGATLGVIGGGQLGRMWVHAAQRMGYAAVVLDPDPASPAGQVAQQHLQADYLDVQALDELAARCAAVTIEFENVPAAALAHLQALRPLAPGAEAVAVCQDRAAEKAHFARCGVACAPHALVDTSAALSAVSGDLLPGILKTARLGYDGKGQRQVYDRGELAQAWQALAQAPCVLEQRMPLQHELSVIVARSRSGDLVHLPVQQNLHRDGILAVTQVPAPDVPEALQQAAVRCTRQIAAALGHVGVLCVEFFVLQDGRLVANEMAPRPHNSGHHSIDACDLSQFDLQVRAMTHAPLPMPRQHSAAVMLNLLGDLWFRRGSDALEPPWDEVLALPGVHLHLYGKAQARAGRKMGHLTVTAATPARARSVAQQAAAVLGIDAF